MADPFQPKFADLVRNFTATTGTGDLVLGEAAPGFRSFTSALQPGDSFYYSAASLTKTTESEVGRGTLLANGAIAREAIGGVPTDFSPGIKSVALVTAAEWFAGVAKADDVKAATQYVASAAGAVERTLVERASDTLSVADFGATGNGAADDAPAVAAALSASAARSLAGVGGKTYRLASWTGHVPAGNLNLELKGSTLRAVATQNLFIGGHDFDVAGGTIDTFATAFVNSIATGTPADMRFTGTRLKNGEAAGINLENPFERYSVAFCRFDNNRGVQVRAGKNDYSLQAGWEGFSAIGNVAHDIRADANAASTGSVGMVLSNAPRSIIALNQVNGMTAGIDAEGFYFYTKSVGGLVFGNAAAGATQGAGAGRFYAINLKGSGRGDLSNPQGYGATALGNYVAGDTDSASIAFFGIQMQADEQAIIANNVDGFKRAVEYSGKISGSIVGLNRGYGNGASSNKAMAGSISGEAVLNIGNIARNYVGGIEYTVTSPDTLDRLSILGIHAQGTGAGSGGVALAVTGTGAGNVTNLLVADATFKGYSAGVNLTQVHGATLANLAFADITNLVGAQRAFQFTNCKRIVGRNCQRTSLQTTNASAASLGEIQVSNENVGILRVRVCSRRSDGSAREVIEARCPFYMEGGTVTLGTPTVTKEFATALAVSFIVASSVRVRAQIAGIASQTWDHFAVIDFDIL